MSITVAQQKTYHFIQRFIKKHQHAPTISEIAAGIGIKSRGAVHRYIKALAAANLIELESGRHRNIQLVEDEQALQLIGLLQKTQIEWLPSPQTENLSKWLTQENRFAIRATESFLDTEGIFDQDILILEKTTKPNNNDIVLVQTIDQLFMIKKLQHNADKTVTLHPLFTRQLPQIYRMEELHIQGVIIAMLRSFASLNTAN